MNDPMQLLRTAEFTVGYSFRALSQSLGATAEVLAEAQRCVERGDVHHGVDIAIPLRERLVEALTLHDRAIGLYQCINPERAAEPNSIEASEPSRTHA